MSLPFWQLVWFRFQFKLRLIHMRDSGVRAPLSSTSSSSDLSGCCDAISALICHLEGATFAWIPSAAQIAADRCTSPFSIGKSCMPAYSSEKLRLTHERPIKPGLELSRET